MRRVDLKQIGAISEYRPIMNTIIENNQIIAFLRNVGALIFIDLTSESGVSLSYVTPCLFESVVAIDLALFSL